MGNRSNVAQDYRHNEVAGYGIAGTRHEGDSQDTLWSSKDAKFPRPEVVEQLGELYLFSDGVTHCADGHLASQLAVQTVRKHYYGQPPSNDQTPSARLRRLQEAVWQAHLQLARWDEKFYCWRTTQHADGQVATYRGQELAKWGKLKDAVARCPLCNKKMAGLQATLLAAVIYQRHLFLVGVGDSFALRIPANSGSSIQRLYDPRSGEFVGSPILPYDQANLPYWEKELKAGDLIVFCSDGVVATLNMKEGERRNRYLRQTLQRESLSRSVPALIDELDTFRQRQPNLDDDLTLLAVGISNGSTPQTPRQQAPNGRQPKKAGHDSQMSHNLTSNGAALRKQALDLARNKGTLTDQHVFYLMDKAVQAGDSEATRWQRAIKCAQEVTAWRSNKLSLHAVSAKRHQEIVHLLTDMELVKTLPQAVSTLRSSLKRAAKQLKKAGQPEIAALYQGLVKQWDAAIEANNAQRADTPSDTTQVLTELTSKRESGSDGSTTTEPSFSASNTPSTKTEPVPSAPSPWALQLAEAEQLKKQGKMIEAACIALKISIPDHLGPSEQEALDRQRQAFVDGAWQLTLEMAHGKPKMMQDQPFQSAMKTLKEAKLSEASGHDADMIRIVAQMRVIQELLLMLFYEQKNDIVSAALTVKRVERVERYQLRSTHNKPVELVRQQRIGRVWEWALNVAHAPRSISPEQREDLQTQANKLSKAEDSRLIAAGRLLEAALHFQANNPYQAAERLFAALEILNDAQQSQLLKLAEGVYLHPWHQVHFWQSEQLKQLKQLRDLAEDRGLKLINPALVSRLNRQIARARNERILALVSPFIVVLVLLAVVTFNFLSTFNPTENQVEAVTPTLSVSPTSEPKTAALPNQGSSTSAELTGLPPTPTVVPATATAPLATVTPPAWIRDVKLPLTAEPVQIEMTLHQAGVNNLYKYFVYFGHRQDQVEENESQLAPVRALTANYPGDHRLQSTQPLRGVLPADPLFLFVGRIDDIVQEHQALRFSLHLFDPSGHRPNVFVKVPSDSLEQLEHHEQWLQAWQNKSPDGGWVWVVGTSLSLSNAVHLCCNHLAQKNDHRIQGGECTSQDTLLNGQEMFYIDAALLIKIEHGVLGEALPSQATFENRWIYADLGPYGLPLAMSDEGPHPIPKPPSGLGLVRASWDSRAIIPFDILQRQEDGIYQRIWP